MNVFMNYKPTEKEVVYLYKRAEVCLIFIMRRLNKK